jgi:hypothetical protein
MDVDLGDGAWGRHRALSAGSAAWAYFHITPDGKSSRCDCRTLRLRILRWSKAGMLVPDD